MMTYCTTISDRGYTRGCILFRNAGILGERGWQAGDAGPTRAGAVFHSIGRMFRARSVTTSYELRQDACAVADTLPMAET